MAVMAVCEVCGNEWPGGSTTCPFCRQPAGPANQERGFCQKTVNLETGRPVAAVALARLTEALAEASRQGVQVLTLIHGYGSSGKGGVIRTECRKALTYLKDKGQIREVIAGEDFHRKAGPVKALLQRFPQMAADRNLDRANRGITVVVVSSVLLCLAQMCSTLQMDTTWLL